MKKLLLLPFLLGFSVPAFAEACNTGLIDGHCLTPEDLKKLKKDIKRRKYYISYRTDVVKYECKDFVMTRTGGGPGGYGAYGGWGEYWYTVRKSDNLVFNNYDAVDSGILKTAKKYCKNPDLPWAPWKEPTS